ncbi:sodium-dependent phosphate transport protein 1 [Octodon degus]|uniref:Sodium-dependent phosphate transport protein 1 n=1 Tax=Octodon degus TaxID=10160 RepID=A0A6P3F6X4_OCTDE|nr:sodium-dependent phosphate transport protein 1 [Octodon degus]XP_023555756.1 sodium-dependent phosphate transport protein 1 [Octodon degus]
MENQVLPKKVPGFFSFRYGLSLLLHFCNGALMMQRTSLSLTMVVMVNGTMGPTNFSSRENSNNIKGPVYNWSPEIQGIILSSIFYGTIIVQIPVGCLSGIFSTKNMIAFGLFLSSVLTLLIPAAAQVGENLLIACRVVQGMAQGAMSVFQHNIWIQWAPPLERGRLTSISVSGVMLGPFIVLLATGLICDFLGWPLVFYIFGAYGCVLCLFWFILFYDDPKDHPFISINEKEYITSSLAQQDNPSTVKTLPIKSVLQSTPFWAISLSHFAFFWSNNFAVAYTPIFVNSVLHVDIRKNGFLSSLPFLFAYCFSILGGYAADFILSKNILSIISVRKLFTTLGMLLPVIFNMCMLYLGFHFYTVIIFLIISQATSSLAIPGTLINVLDIAPRYYGVLKGVATLIGMIGGIISSTVSGLILSMKSETSWHKIYFLMSAINISALIFYLIFAKAEIQDWAKESQDTRL